MAAQRRTLSAEKVLISGAFLRAKRVRVAVSICTCQNPFLTFYKGEISMGNKLKTVDAETLLSTPMSKTMFIVDGSFRRASMSSAVPARSAKAG